MPRLLIIDDDHSTCYLLKKFLSNRGFQVDIVHTGMDGLRSIYRSNYDIIICDLRLPDMLGTELLDNINVNNEKILFIIITGYSDIKTAVKAIKAGAINYITKPVNPDELINDIENALQFGDLSDGSIKPEKAVFIAKSEISRKIIEEADLIAPTELTTLITGETGSGKEMLANYIHKNSKRKGKPFIALDCGALTSELAVSELFGHVKGAFTGAGDEKKGLFEEAEGGTLFLDEIGNLSYDNQVKLLRALQERKIKRIGGERDISVNVRIIAATNEDLKKKINNYKFREDLYYRINEFNINLPPLRERKEDLLILANFFLKAANSRLNKKVIGFDDEVIKKFNTYQWSGNIRELKNTINRGVLLCKSDKFDLTCLTLDYLDHSTEVINECQKSSNLKDLKKVTEKATIINTLINNKYNKTITAKKLNINRTTLYIKMKEYNIDF